MDKQIIPVNYYVYLAVFIVHIGALISGISMTWPSPVITKLSRLDDNPLGRIITSTEQSILGAIPTIGCLIGCFATGYLAKKYGRKPLLILLEIPTVIAYFVMCLSTNIWELYAARTLTGLTVGGVFTVNTMYVAEVAENSNRGLLGTAVTCFINFGLLFSLLLGPLTSYLWFHIILSAFPILLIPLIYLYVPESPYYLIKRDPTKAKAVLMKLRGRADVETELDIIAQSSNTETKIRIQYMFGNKGLRKGIIIGCGLILFQQLTGTAVIMSYGEQIFAEIDEGTPSAVGPVIITGIQFLVGFVAPLVSDKAGRKILLLISYVGITVAHVLFGIYFVMRYGSESIGFFSYLPLASLIIYIITYSLGSGPIPWTVIGEIFPLEVKESATSICVTLLNVLAFIMLLTFNFVKDSIGIGPTFWIFSAFGLLATLFVQYYVIETKGKSLQEIQNELND
ncbi:hypothetical protein WA026_012228 [Henosepilachna vigintioctopunctata]|uniref:Major facilitator superfamily (MFS) profile domain-containing protein n=1 Tax=Henosepilachna vigintioctopunctata TaxID=420089 RepID=A0AAW1VCW4_9CUCU